MREPGVKRGCAGFAGEDGLDEGFLLVGGFVNTCKVGLSASEESTAAEETGWPQATHDEVAGARSEPHDLHFCMKESAIRAVDEVSYSITRGGNSRKRLQGVRKENYTIR